MSSDSEDNPRVFLPRRAAPEDLVRPTRAEISLSNLRHNLHMLQESAGVPVWCVLKADAYGHGAKAVARTLERAGAAGVCVALLEEAIELREAGIQLPILVMSGHYTGAWGELLRHRLTPVVFRPDQLRAFAEEVRYAGAPPAAVHLKIDTGMGRLGVELNELEPLLHTFSECRELRLEGLMTHFANAEHDPASVAAQLERFARAQTALREHSLHPELCHAANTAALLKYPEARLDRVRPGIGVFGLAPGVGEGARLKPVMRLRSQIIALRRLAPGGTVGYGSTWKAERSSLIATVPLGYADGFARVLSNKADVLVRGHRAPVAGVISMDLTGIDVTDIAGVALGDEVVALGQQRGPLGTGTIGAEELAQKAGTIAWEVLTSVSRRVPRFYRES
jgi:alanine racemase